MALKISSASLSRVREQALKMQSRLKNVSQKAEESMERALDGAITGATAAALGVMHGRHGTVEVVGIPVELLGGLGLHGLGFFGFGGKMKNHFHSIANGGIAVYAYNLGKGTGLAWKSKASLPGATVKGELPSDRLSSDEVERMQTPVSAQRR